MREPNVHVVRFLPRLLLALLLLALLLMTTLMSSMCLWEGLDSMHAVVSGILAKLFETCCHFHQTTVRFCRVGSQSRQDLWTSYDCDDEDHSRLPIRQLRRVCTPALPLFAIFRECPKMAARNDYRTVSRKQRQWGPTPLLPAEFGLMRHAVPRLAWRKQGARELETCA